MADTPEKPQTPPNSGSSLAEVANIMSYPIAGFLGYTTASTSIRKSMYENIAKKGVFNDLQKTRSEQYKAAIAEAEAAGGEKGLLAGRLEKIEGQYRAGVRQWFNKHGVEDITDYWQTLQRNQKIDALVLGATVSGIALGALLTITHNRSLSTDVLHTSEDTPGKS